MRRPDSDGRDSISTQCMMSVPSPSGTLDTEARGGNSYTAALPALGNVTDKHAWRSGSCHREGEPAPKERTGCRNSEVETTTVRAPGKGTTISCQANGAEAVRKSS